MECRDHPLHHPLENSIIGHLKSARTACYADQFQTKRVFIIAHLALLIDQFIRNFTRALRLSWLPRWACRHGKLWWSKQVRSSPFALCALEVYVSLSLSRCITHRLVTFPNDETKTKLFYRYFFANTQYDLCKPFSTLIDLNSHGICKWNRQALICSKHFEDHGCYHELCRLLGKINVHRQNLFLLGQEKKELGHHANHKHPFLTIACA